MNIQYTIANRFWRNATMALMMLLWLLPMTGKAQTVTIGANSGVNTTTTYPAAYGQWYTSSRQQFLYRASELTAQGVVSGALITSIGFNITSIGTSAPHQNYTIWLANTTQTTLADAWIPMPGTATPFYGGTGFTQAPSVGTNTFATTGAPFVWTGGSLVVQVSFSNGLSSWTQNAINEITTGLSFAGSRGLLTDGAYDLGTLNDPTATTFYGNTGTPANAASTSRPRLVLTFIPPTPCTSPVTGGTAIATPSNFCGTGTTTLTVTGGTGLATGLSYEWEQSTNGGTSWSPIVPSATSASFTTGIVSATTMYRRKITCANGGGTDYSLPATFAAASSPPFATLPYVQDFETWQDKCAVKEIPGTNWANTPSTGNLSWRRQDEGVTAGWTNPTNNSSVGNMTPISGNGAACFHAGGFPTTGNIGGQQGWLDLHVNMSSTFVKEVRFLYRNRQQFAYVPPTPGADRQWLPIHTDQMEVLLSTDGGITFPTTLGVYGSETLDSIPPAPVPPAFAQSVNRPLEWKRIAVKVGAVSPTVVIRFRATTSPFYPLPIGGGIQSDIGIDDVQVVELKPCSGTPIAGTIFGNFKLCDPGTVYLSVTGSEDLLGGQDYEFLWETSINGTDWTPAVGNNTQPDYTTPVLSNEPFYRRRITCKNGGAFINTPVIQIQQVRPTPVVVTPGIAGRYVQLFESWVDGCRLKQLPDVAWKNTPNIGNRSWRKNGDVLQTSVPPNVGQWFINFVAPANSLTSFANGPGSTGCAEFFSRGAAGGGDLDLYANLSASTNRKALQFYISNTNGGDNLTVLSAQNGNASNPTFIPQGDPIFASPNPAWARRGFFIESNSANHVFRFNGIGDLSAANTSDIGLDSLIVIDLPPCNARPHGGQASASPANFCQGSQITISVSSNAPTVYASDDPAWATDDGHIFRWQISTDGGTTWNNIPNATGATYQFTAQAQPNAPQRQYRRKIMCPVDTIAMVAFSNAVTLEFPYQMAYANIPYYQGFEDTWATPTLLGPCSGGTTPTQTAIRPVTPLIQNDAANTAVPARNLHWRSVSANNRGTWRRTNGTTTPTGFTTGGGWTAYGRTFPIGTGAATFNGFGGGGTRSGSIDLYLNGTGTQMKQLRFRYRNPQRPTPTVAAFTPPQWPEEEYNPGKDKLELEMSFNNGRDFNQRLELQVAPSWMPYYINFDNDAPQTVIRFKGTAFTTQSPTFPPRNEGTDLGLDEVFVVYVNDCATAGALVGGTAANATANTMPDFNFCYFPPYAVYVTGSSDETHYGFEYQWEFSSDNVEPYVAIAGATNMNYVMQTAQVGFFRRVIKCTATGATATSTSVQMAFTNPVVYATLPYRQSFETWGNGCGVSDRPDASWVNSPFTGQTSWRRQNEGRLANWAFNFPEALPTAIHGQGCATFHNYFIAGAGTDAPPSTASQGKFDLYVNCSPVGTKQLRFWYTNPDIPNSLNGLGNNDKMEIFVSTDGGATFTKIGEMGKQDGWIEKTYSFQSNSASTVIRFLCNWQPDDSDIGLDEVRVDVLSNCVAAGSILGGTAKPSTVSGNACTTLSLLLFVEGSASDTQEGLEYKWQYSLNGGTTWLWALNPNGTLVTTPNLEVSPVATTHYRRITKCTASADSSLSVPYIFFIASSPEFAELPYSEDFERWGDACDDNDVPFPATNKIHWVSRPFTGNNAWRRTGEEATGGWIDLNTAAWTQGGRVIPASGAGAASFHSFSAANRTTGDMQLYLNTASADPNATKLLEFDYSNADYPTNVPGLTNDDKLEIYLSKDGGATYGTLPLVILDRTKDLWETKRIVFDNVEQPFLNAQNVVFRFRGVADNGGTDIGIDNLTFRVMPNFDAGVTSVEFNRCSPVFGRVVIEVTNFGSQAIQNFPVQFTIGTNTFTEIFPTRLERFQKAKFEFSSPINIAGVSTLTISAKTNLSGDAVASNDSRTVSLTVSAYAGLTHATPTSPTGTFSENFDSGIPANWRVQGKPNTPSWFSARENDGLPANAAADPDEFPSNLFQYAVFGGGGGGFSNRFVAVDDNKGGAARSFDSDRLISPSFDFTNYSDIQVKFDAYNTYGLSFPVGGSIFFEYSIDDGATWTQHAEIIGDGDGSIDAYENPTYLLPTLAGKSRVRFAFKYNDKGLITGGAAIDNFNVLGTATALPDARFTTPAVNRAFVNRGTDAHTVYRFNVEAKDASVILSDVILKTGAQDYKVEDFKPNSFRLFVSNDTILSANDRNLGTVPVVPKGQDVVFSCLNYAIPMSQTNYFFFTVDVANAPTATLGDSIQVQLPTVANNFITITGQRTAVSVREGGHQIIADPNKFPTSEELVFEMKKKEKDSDPNLLFKAADFKFADLDAPFVDVNVFKKLRITTKSIPTGAKLQLNGVDIVANQEINASQIQNMVFTPRLNEAALSYATFTFKVYDGRDWSTLDYTAKINVVSDRIFIPTLFSPNGDGANDIFVIRGGEANIETLTLKIVDRNNNPMYESSNISEIQTKGWDGKKSGKDQPTGSYVWYIEGSYRDGKPVEFNGKKTGVIRLVR